MLKAVDLDDLSLDDLEDVVLSSTHYAFKQRSVTFTTPRPSLTCCIISVLIIGLVCLSSLLIAGTIEYRDSKHPVDNPVVDPCTTQPTQVVPYIPTGVVNSLTYSKPTGFEFTLEPGGLFQITLNQGTYAIFATTAGMIAPSDVDSISFQPCSTQCAALGYVNGPCPTTNYGVMCTSRTMKPFGLVFDVLQLSTFSIRSASGSTYSIIALISKLA